MNVLRSMMGNRSAAIGLTVLGGLVLAATLAPVVSGDPLAQHDILRTRFLPPLTRGPDDVLHLLGTDRLGRDVLTRLLYGARISLGVGISSVTLALLIGCAVGMTSALLGGATERVLMAMTDAALAMPRLVLLLALVAMWEPSLTLVIVVLGMTGWMSIARLARAEVKQLLARPFIDAAKANGASATTLLRRHVLPNALTPIVVAAALAVGNAITLESGLAFLGLGVPAPAPSWGNMISGGRDALVNAPWIATFPGLAIVLVVIAFNVVGDGLRDALDPTTRQGRNSRVTTSRGSATNES